MLWVLVFPMCTLRNDTNAARSMLIDYRERELAGLAIGTQEKYMLAVSSFCKKGTCVSMRRTSSSSRVWVHCRTSFSSWFT